MKVLIVEHIAGGGLFSQPLSPGMFSQGAGMLCALVSDFIKRGDQVITTLDRRLIASDIACSLSASQTLPCDLTETINRRLIETLPTCDAVCVIAPETDGILSKYLQTLEHMHANHTAPLQILNCSVQTVGLCADKMLLAYHFESHDVPTPGTRLLEKCCDAMLSSSQAVVVKPRDGAGCEQTYLCHSHNALTHLHRKLQPQNAICQPWLIGTPTSVSFILHGDHMTPLLAGQQAINQKQTDIPGLQQLEYVGGHVSLEPTLAHRAIAIAKRALHTLSGLAGFVGVDVVLGKTPESDYVIEVNPRLTVSYSALSRLCLDNLAGLMLGDSPHDTPLQWASSDLAYDTAGKTVTSKSLTAQVTCSRI